MKRKDTVERKVKVILEKLKGRDERKNVSIKRKCEKRRKKDKRS